MSFYLPPQLNKALNDYERHFKGKYFYYTGHTEEEADAAVKEIYQRIKDNNPSTKEYPKGVDLD